MHLLIANNIETLKLALLFGSGILAGIINTLAGGGSALTLPVLVLCGLPSPVANATNRVAIFFQNLTASAKFRRHGELEITPILPIAIAAMCGSVIGSLFATQIASAVFDKILGILLIFILIMILKPKKIQKTSGKKLPKILEILLFFGIGIYGGFIQVGVGFIFIASLNLLEHKNLIKSNAIKVFIIGLYTFFALVIFAIADKIVWKYGLVLAVGNSIGAFLGVKLALKRGESMVKIILTLAVIASFLKLFGILKF
jgi:uncharacterized membrane protein YfcA